MTNAATMQHITRGVTSVRNGILSLLYIVPTNNANAILQVCRSSFRRSAPKKLGTVPTPLSEGAIGPVRTADSVAGTG